MPRRLRGWERIPVNRRISSPTGGLLSTNPRPSFRPGVSMTDNASDPSRQRTDAEAVDMPMFPDRQTSRPLAGSTLLTRPISRGARPRGSRKRMTEQNNWQPGAIANGHILVEGEGWVPLAEHERRLRAAQSPPSPKPTSEASTPGPAKAAWYKRNMGRRGLGLRSRSHPWGCLSRVGEPD